MKKKWTLVLDLDDTLINTFRLLIEPLEFGFCKKVDDNFPNVFDTSLLYNEILKFRINNPSRINDIFHQHKPELANKIIEMRSKYFTDFEVDNIYMEPEDILLLQDYNLIHNLILLTEGNLIIQNKKIAALKVEKYFDMIIIDHEPVGKFNILKRLTKDKSNDKNKFIVIGNRVDKEIDSAMRLGLPSIWVKQGEGSGILWSSFQGPLLFTVNTFLDTAEAVAMITKEGI